MTFTSRVRQPCSVGAGIESLGDPLCHVADVLYVNRSLVIISENFAYLDSHTVECEILASSFIYWAVPILSFSVAGWVREALARMKCPQGPYLSLVYMAEAFRWSELAQGRQRTLLRAYPVGKIDVAFRRTLFSTRWTRGPYMWNTLLRKFFLFRLGTIFFMHFKYCALLNEVSFILTQVTEPYAFLTPKRTARQYFLDQQDITHCLPTTSRNLPPICAFLWSHIGRQTLRSCCPTL